MAAEPDYQDSRVVCASAAGLNYECSSDSIWARKLLFKSRSSVWPRNWLYYPDPISEKLFGFAYVKLSKSPSSLAITAI